MEGEIYNFLKVWFQVLVLSWYCYLVEKVVPKGTTRLICYLPVIYHFLILPFNLTTFHFTVVTSYYISWLANFKLLLVAFGVGPLSDPSLSLGRFTLVLSLPIKILQGNTVTGQSHSPKNGVILYIVSIFFERRDGLKPFLNYAVKAYWFLNMIFITGYFKNYVDLLNPRIFHFFIGLYIYVGLELLLACTAFVAQILLGTRVEAQFGEPYLAVSLKDFWRRQWNLMSSDILCITIFKPILQVSTPVMGSECALVLAVFGTFIVSCFMHELLFYHVGRLRLTWGPMLYFLLNAVCLLIETVLGSFTSKFKLPRLVSGLAIFGLQILAFNELVMPSMLRWDPVGKSFNDYEAVFTFVTNLFTTSKHQSLEKVTNTKY